jgi:hypothetical protein
MLPRCLLQPTKDVVNVPFLDMDMYTNIAHVDEQLLCYQESHMACAHMLLVAFLYRYVE